MSGDRQRIDKWLWFARVVKTRALAQDLAESGRVRLNGRKIDAAAQPVRIGDVLTIAVAGRVRVLEVRGFAERRGGAPEARTLFLDRLSGPDVVSGEDTGEPGATPDDDEADVRGSPGRRR